VIRGKIASGNRPYRKLGQTRTLPGRIPHGAGCRQMVGGPGFPVLGRGGASVISGGGLPCRAAMLSSMTMSGDCLEFARRVPQEGRGVSQTSGKGD
jgi:hypothetical protein